MNLRTCIILLASLSLLNACKEKDDIPMDIQCPNPAADHKPRHPLPDAFTPDGDGRNDRLFPFPDSTITAVEQAVYDRSGDLIAIESTPSGWDGKDQAGNVVSPAPYRVKYRVSHSNAPTVTGELWVTIFGPAAGEKCVQAPPDCDPNSYTFPDQYDFSGNWYATAETICVK